MCNRSPLQKYRVSQYGASCLIHYNPRRGNARWTVDNFYGGQLHTVSMSSLALCSLKKCCEKFASRLNFSVLRIHIFCSRQITRRRPSLPDNTFNRLSCRQRRHRAHMLFGRRRRLVPFLVCIESTHYIPYVCTYSLTHKKHLLKS